MSSAQRSIELATGEPLAPASLASLSFVAANASPAPTTDIATAVPSARNMQALLDHCDMLSCI